MPRSCLRHLKRYLAEGRPELVRSDDSSQGRFLVTRVGDPLLPKTLRLVVQRISNRARIPAHPHAFRRAIASHLVRRGASVVAVQRLLGHADLDMTARYVGLEQGDLRQAVAVLEISG